MDEYLLLRIGESSIHIIGIATIGNQTSRQMELKRMYILRILLFEICIKKTIYMQKKDL
jgi:hypothetical protein